MRESARMAIEIIGTFSHRDSAEHRQAPLSKFDTAFIRELVAAYDRNGYDRMLIANGATWPDSIPFAAFIAGITERVGWMIAHRPGFVTPTMAARLELSRSEATFLKSVQVPSTPTETSTDSEKR